MAILLVALAIINFIIYHKFFRVIYFGNMGPKLVAEMAMCFIVAAFELVILAFQLITLPVEFDASKRALAIIEKEAMVNNSEHKGAKTMLTSAALTYVAGVLSALFEILRLVLIARDRD